MIIILMVIMITDLVIRTMDTGMDMDTEAALITGGRGVISVIHTAASAIAVQGSIAAAGILPIGVKEAVRN